ncbi:flagella basal body P-ring formation protein FlgA [Helicobacter cholecystus]|uniref:Flagella basal body P-ring formation protein FlgA n=1 Tax=Helicobacter cholecystus TaxID=45498 RepID=A0A3D8IYD2_9HELI|nr:flagellar basal body P-ring formation chaperone FlgA [Helicobacter cholecystus]RDU70063.1 flagella basal body P-ring formation protein FlgA [Helicobacter cholecystus]VEJ24766.1 flagellar basal body P-ring biosynthesis protein FlgA [Helicobacter cholecystus]
MRLSLFFLFVFFAFGVNLQEEYKVKGNEIYSNDLIADAPRFFIARFGDTFEFEIPSADLIALFKRYGIKLEATKDMTKFIYQTPKAFANLQKQVKKFFLQAYPSLKIKTIYLKPLSKASDTSFEALLTPSVLKKSKFEFLAKSTPKEGGIIFACEIVGEIEVYLASEDIRSRQIFNPSNIQKQNIAFKGFLQEPALYEDLMNSQAKGFIKKAQIITRNKLSPRTLIEKGGMIDVVLQEGGVRVEMRVEALKSGSLGEVIPARNPTSKKNLKIKVIAEGKGEVL